MIDFNPTAAIKTIADKLKNKKLANTKTVEKEIAAVASYLGLTESQTLLFVALFDRQTTGMESDIEDIADYYYVSTLEILARKKDFDAMLDKGYIAPKSLKPSAFAKTEFCICKTVYNCVIDAVPISVSEADKPKMDRFEFIRYIGEMTEDRGRCDTDPGELYASLLRLEESHPEFTFVPPVKEMVPDVPSRVLLYDCLFDFLKGCDDNTDVERTVKDIYVRVNDIMRVRKAFEMKTHSLITEGLLECWRESEHYSLMPTEKILRLVFEEDYELFTKDVKSADVFQFVKNVHSKVMQRRDKEYPTFTLFREVEEIEEKNMHLPMIEKLKAVVPKIEDRVLFYEACGGVTRDSMPLGRVLMCIYDSQKDRALARRQFKAEKHFLQKADLVEVGLEDFFGEDSLELSDLGLSVFLGEDAELFAKEKGAKNLLIPEDIRQKKLFYSNSTEDELAFLRDSLQEENYAGLKARLSEKGLPTGVAALFYGAPGTGKTESVYQIAKATGRGVLQVDISEMKTCWYGESQKLVKGVFKKYSRMCKAGKAPILLFNEADAVFGRRKENPEHSVDQTENAIQNIILEEMEKLQGILIATTNFEVNLDPAFERRFLFKVKFEKPTVEAKTLIWKDKMPVLSDSDAAYLAENYDFSGGEIDNIVRKCTMKEVLNGEAPTLSGIVALCSDEKLTSGTRAKIGF